MVIAFYTPKYMDEALEFIKSCNTYGVDNEVVAMPDRGSWVANTHFKPLFIRDKLRELEEDLWYVDVDARFVGKPNLLHMIDSSYDIGFYYNTRRGGKELLAGTLYIPYKERTLLVMDKWCEACETPGTSNEQMKLQKIVEGGDYKVYLLPQNYCKIFDFPKVCEGDIIIEHLQASRRLRK
jgi:hypothetical protein